MKKINFLFMVLILSACATPQVTVTSQVTVTLAPPTETPIPTLHPEFIAWQELISASGRYTLTPDGLIQDNGVVIHGLQIDSNGIMTLTVNNEKIILTTSDITFAEDGIKTKNYVLETGVWESALSKAMQTLNTDFEKYILSPENYTIVEQGDNLEVTDPETGEVVYKNGSFDPMFLGNRIKTLGMCKKTEWEGTKIGAINPSGLDLMEHLDQYLQPLADAKSLFVKNKMITNPGFDATNYFFGNGCWGVVFSKSKGQTDARMFWKDSQGKPKHQLVFLTNIE